MYKKSFAIVVGIAHYQDIKINELECAEDDANELAKVLAATGFEYVYKLVGRQATKANLITALTSCAQAITQNDRLLVYLTGAVQMKDEMGYFCMYEHNTENPTSGIALGAELLPYIQECSAKHTLITLDCHHSHLFFTSHQDGHQPFQILTAQPKGKSALESDKEDQRGMLSTYLLKALKGDSFNEDQSWISTSQVAQYMQQKMTEDGVKLEVKTQWIGRENVPCDFSSCNAPIISRKKTRDFSSSKLLAHYMKKSSMEYLLFTFTSQSRQGYSR